MDLIKLEENLRLNIPEIDAQHEELIGLINRLHEAMLHAAEKAVLDKLLSQLIEHTRTHFATEEQLMSQYGYPGFEAHKSEHTRLMQHLEGLAKRFDDGELLLSFAVVLELKGWAMVHIEKSDKPLGDYITSRKGGEAAPGQ
ncbi:MAG: bacteriohemerythrin [Gammaproteobacteria bacterium]